MKDNLNRQIEATNAKQEELNKQTAIQKAKLESIAELTAQQAKEQLINLMQEEARAEASILVKDIIDEAKTSAAFEAKKLVIKSIQRTGVEAALENTVSVFNIENIGCIICKKLTVVNNVCTGFKAFFSCFCNHVTNHHN